MIRRMLVAALTRTPVGDLARALPAVSDLYRDRIWAGDMNHLWGVFDTKEAALAAVPKGNDTGWDTPQMHLELVAQPSAYASLFWLGRNVAPGGRVVDVGGGLGTLYFDAVRRGGLPAGVRWRVVEVPALLEPARKRAAELNAEGLEFCAALPADEPAPDMLVAAGFMQYVHHDLKSFLADLPFTPDRIIINKLALTQHPSFWTLQNFGASFSPYRIYNTDAFVAEIEQLGYTIVDRWRVPEIELPIPFHPKKRVQGLTGLYLERRR